MSFWSEKSNSEKKVLGSGLLTKKVGRSKVMTNEYFLKILGPTHRLRPIFNPS